MRLGCAQSTPVSDTGRPRALAGRHRRALSAGDLQASPRDVPLSMSPAQVQSPRTGRSAEGRPSCSPSANATASREPSSVSDTGRPRALAGRHRRALSAGDLQASPRDVPLSMSPAQLLSPRTGRSAETRPSCSPGANATASRKHPSVSDTGRPRALAGRHRRALSAGDLQASPRDVPLSMGPAQVLSLRTGRLTGRPRALAGRHRRALSAGDLRASPRDVPLSMGPARPHSPSVRSERSDPSGRLVRSLLLGCSAAARPSESPCVEPPAAVRRTNSPRPPPPGRS